MMMPLLQTILGATNDDTAGLVKILIVVIFFAFSIISSVLKNKSKKPSRQQGGRTAGSSARAPSQGLQNPDDKLPRPTQGLGQHSPGEAIAEQPVKKPGPARPPEVTLRPSSVGLSRKSPAQHYTSGGFREALSGKSRLDRFLEAKLEPRRRQTPECDLQESHETPGAMAGLEKMGGLEEMAGFEGATTTSDEQSEVITSLKLDSENLADAVVFAEILGKPLALRDTYI
jgi:hypothetical protein